MLTIKELSTIKEGLWVLMNDKYSMPREPDRFVERVVEIHIIMGLVEDLMQNLHNERIEKEGL